MSTTALRAAMIPVSRRMRAYFAPVNRTTETPTIFDPGQAGMFLLDSPPSPWMELGWIEGFQRFCATETEPLRAGAQGAAATQFRSGLEARIEFEFREWGKLQMALACGAEHMNVLATNAGGSPQASGGLPVPGVAVLAGSTASEIVLGTGAVSGFAAGSLVAVDVDYQQQVGYVGTGIAGAYVSNPANVNRDANYVRRVTFNVARVAEVTATALLLAQPLPGGAPLTGASAQQVVAFVDREGGAFFQEWSGLFVAEEESGGRVCFFYPRLSATTSLKTAASGNASGALSWQREEFVEVSSPIGALALRAAFLALPYVDGNDGQTVVGYRSYFPAAMAGAW